MSNENFTQKRKYYRVTYPPGDRPVVMVNRRPFEAVDVSEEGIRFLVEGKICPDFAPKSTVNGEITFGKRGKHAFKATVLRLTSEFCVLKLKDFVPLAIMMTEQRYLLQKYTSV